MTAKIAGQKPTPIPGPRSSHAYQKIALSGTTFYNGGISALDPSTGQWAKPDGTNPALICHGFNRLGDVDHIVGGNDVNGNPIEMLVDSGCYLVIGSGLVTSNEGAVAYCSDDQTFSLIPGSRPVLGIVQLVVDSTHAYVFVDPIVNAGMQASAAVKSRCRGVFQNSVPVYTGSKTATLTVTATGALGTEDGLTPAINEVWFFQEGSTNLTDPADAGPWVISNPGGTGIQPVLVRPTWWSHGSPIPLHAVIDIGPEGTGTDPKYASTSWVSWAAPGKVVGSDAPVFWPRRISSAVTLASGTLAAARRTLPIRDHLNTDFIITSDPTTAPHASTKVWRVSAVTPGVTNTASIQMVAESAPGTTNTSDVGQYNLTVQNGG
jgi:hypothetical protein